MNVRMVRVHAVRVNGGVGLTKILLMTLHNVLASLRANKGGKQLGGAVQTQTVVDAQVVVFVMELAEVVAEEEVLPHHRHARAVRVQRIATAGFTCRNQGAAAAVVLTLGAALSGSAGLSALLQEIAGILHPGATHAPATIIPPV